MSKEEIAVFPDVTTELLARVGEAELMKAMMGHNCLLRNKVITSDMDIPEVGIRVLDEGEDMTVLFKVGDEPRRLVYVPGFDWMWYNADGVEE